MEWSTLSSTAFSILSTNTNEIVISITNEKSFKRKKSFRLYVLYISMRPHKFGRCPENCSGRGLLMQ